MERTVTLPLWLALLLLGLAAVALLDRLLVPGLRWYLRRRVNLVIDRLNARLKLHIQPFKLTRREVLVDRLIHDPRVLEAVEALVAAGEARLLVQRRVALYAREIVPAFKPYAYFQVGYRVARTVARLLYRVRVGYQDDEGLSRVDPRASVVFVVNHRSNMDYVLVAYLAAERTALSYAVGEWAQVWPLHTLIRSMGAYFIRRNSKDPIYRRVLERYVQMATEAGVVQAVFPEGGLSRDGALRPARLGLIDYMLRTFDPSAGRDLCFVPVGINYDRVLEDRALLAQAGGEAPRGLVATTATATRFGLRQAALWALGRWHRFGYACVNFGTPISMTAWSAARGVDWRTLTKEARSARLGELGEELMAAVGRVVPALPVSLLATALLEDDRPVATLALHARTQALMRRLSAAGAHVYLPREDEAYAIAVGLRMLVERRLVEEGPAGWAPVEAERPVLRYYAAAIAPLVGAAPPSEGRSTAAPTGATLPEP
ncbi:MAG: 1-acyl-sn-glycerol-3-phosphate acyltransferase [Anaeromyxobacter sp.]|nr:1-acyl-sn-glycerol-3-phosphate acyltransferase [Anaeromyxobacter sp.]MBL0275416.1 1-acyl-sn-glycerol-3-phosphate acyltransferase [Anaeromyxobacter sp.]